MRILFLCLGSYIVKDTTGADKDNFDRQLLYAIALNRLSQIAPEGSNILVVENTANSKDQLHKPLQAALALPKIKEVLFSQDNALGAKNKGAGEYGLCKYAYEKRKDLFDQAEWVVYYTHRHIMAFPLLFEYLKKYPEADAIVSNAKYFYLDGSTSVPAPDQFDDLIFAMKKQVFLKYLENMQPEMLVKKRIGSEQNLYQFLTSQSLKIKVVEHFGVFRYNYFDYQMEIV